MSTKLKLLGVDVASFGDAQGRTPGCQSYQWTDGPQQIYKKIVVSQDGKALLGGVLVGDASDYATLLRDDAERHGAAAASGESDPARAGGSRAEGARRPRRCRTARRSAPCHNVSKGDICQAG